MGEEVQYWLTSHNPHVGSALFDWNLYLRPKDVSPNTTPRKGDRAMIYEQASGEVDGKQQNCGRGGIVVVTDILDGWKPRTSNLVFSLEAACDLYPDSEGFVPRVDSNVVLGFAPTYTMIGFGANTGLLRISKDQFDRLFAIFKANKRT